MKGLLLKDMINLKSQAKIYLLIIGIWMAAAVLEKNGILFTCMMTILPVMVPIMTFSFDEKARWEKYALTMPVSRKDIVISKYLLSILLSIISTILSFAVSAAISGELYNTFLSSMFTFVLAIFALSIILPIIFKFGSEKGRIILMAVIFVPSIISLLLSQLKIKFDISQLIDRLTDSLFALPVLAAIFLFISIAISGNIYEHREF